MSSSPVISPRYREAIEWGVRQFQALRPRFYNGITWTLVVTGALLMGGPLWERVIAALLERNFDLQITSGGHDTAWGFAVIVVGVVYQLAMQGYAQRHDALQNARSDVTRTQHQAHDQAQFQKLQELMSEKKLLHFFEWLGTNHGSSLERLYDFDRLTDLLDEPESQFLDETLQDSAKQLLTSFRKLGTFIDYHFFALRGQPTEQGLYLYPDLNIDRGGSGKPEEMARYDQFSEQLHDLIDAAEADYKAFRAKIKRTLAI